MAKIGSLLASIGLDTAEFTQGIKRANTSIDRFRRDMRRSMRETQRSIDQVAGGMQRMIGIVVALAGPAAMGALVNRQRQLLDEQQKFARVVGTTQSRLMGLQLAATEISGVMDRQTNMALQRMARRLAEARAGAGEALPVLKALKVDIESLATDDPVEAFFRLSDAVQAVEDPSERLRIAFKLFDSEGARLVTTLSAGSKELRQYEQFTRDIGLAMSEFDIRKIEVMNDTWGRVGKSIQGMGNILAVEFAPALNAVANQFVGSAEKSDEFRQVVGNSMTNVAAAIAMVLDAGHMMRVMWKGLQVRVQQFVGAAMASLAELGVIEWPQVALYAQQVAAAAEEHQKLLLEARPGQEFLENTWKNINEQLELTPLQLEKLQTILGQLGPVATQNAQKITNAFDGFFDGFESGVDGMLQTFRKNLQQMAAEMLSSRLLELIPALGGTTGVGGFFGRLLGFAHGGNFTVGGNGGTDSQLVAFRASPGEQVSVRTPGQAAGGDGGGVVINQHNTFNGMSAADVAMIRVALQENKEMTKAEILNMMARKKV